MKVLGLLLRSAKTARRVIVKLLLNLVHLRALILLFLASHWTTLLSFGVCIFSKFKIMDSLSRKRKKALTSDDYFRCCMKLKLSLVSGYKLHTIQL